MTDPRLRAVVAAQPYPLLFVTVSGAHLYGFPSPDSDYDGRRSGHGGLAAGGRHIDASFTPA